MSKYVAKPAAATVVVVVIAAMVCTHAAGVATAVDVTADVDHSPVLLPPWPATWVMNLSTIIQVIDLDCS
jgi:hypothetical protein